MANVRPFRGLCYDVGKVGDLSSVITPPYDVISPEQQKAYYGRNPHNIIRLEFGEELLGDDPQSNKYSRAAQFLQDWLRQGVLVQESRPAFYLTEHCFPQEGRRQSYWGLVARVKLEEFGTGTIRPTEVTMNAPAEDRLRLIRACRANLSPTMGIFDHGDADLKSLFLGVDFNRPTAKAEDNAGVVFRLWAVTDREIVAKVSASLAPKIIYIADGHHRYRTALAYREEQRAARPDLGPEDACNFVMMTLISAADPGLALLPTHRMVRNIEPRKLAGLKDRLAADFHVRRLSPTSSDPAVNLAAWTTSLAEAGGTGGSFGIYGLDGANCWLLTPRDLGSLRRTLPSDKPPAWNNLDVSLLHVVILQRMLGIEGPEKEKECLAYSPEGVEVLSRIDAGRAQFAVLLNPVSIAAVMAVADAGVRMPPKSTYFYPKTAAGLVVNPLF